MEDYDENFVELRAAFNNLPRPAKTPDGTSNHWQFSIHFVPGNKFDTLVHIFNPESGFSHFERAERNLLEKNIDIQAEWTVSHLMKAFLTSFGRIHQIDGVKLFGPLTWGTSDAALAQATRKVLVEMKVREELCTVNCGDVSNFLLEQEAWEKLAKKLAAIGMQGDTCQTCKRWATNNDILSLCSGCRKAHYCSKGCQKQDWKKHKPNCKIDGESKKELVQALTYDYTLEQLHHVIQETGLLGLEQDRSYAYFRTVAALKPEVQELAKKIKWPIPGAPQGLIPIVRRLVITGEDTPANHAMLFGTPMDTQARLFCLELRMEALLEPDSASIVGKEIRKRGFDKDWPWWTWKVRGPSDEEKRELAKIRKIQDYIREYRMLNPDRQLVSQERNILGNQDREILEKHFGGRWKEQERRFQMALLSMELVGDMKESYVSPFQPWQQLLIARMQSYI